MLFGFISLWKYFLSSLPSRDDIFNYFRLKAGVCSLEFYNWKPPKFNGSKQVRVLLFRECDWRGRKLLFDSKSVKKLSRQDLNSSCDLKRLKVNGHVTGSNTIPRRKNDQHREVASDGTVYQYLKPCSDVKMLGEMIFGSVTMSYKGDTVKVHTVRSPQELMLSVVFPAPLPNKKMGDRDLEVSSSLHNSTSEILISKCGEKMESLCVAHSVPVDVPGHTSVLQQRNDGGCLPSGSHTFLADSLHSTASSNSLLSFPVTPDTASSSLSHSGSFSSLQRRWLRNLTTSMEVWLRRRSEDSPQSEEPKRSSGHTRTRLGLSIIISLEEGNLEEERFHDFFFSHIALIESHVTQLKDLVLGSYLNRKNFVNAIYKGVEQLQASLQDLVTGPRLMSPVWLSMMSPSVNHHLHCTRFISEFIALLEEFDTKYTNFFVSTLLTAVLTHHLAWVPTVSPPGVTTNHFDHRKHTAQWVDMLAKSHPYNPLWMQLGDLYGALGTPTKLSKTVITGKKADVILRFLYILSYFIRCSDICEYEQDWSKSDKGKWIHQNTSSSEATHKLGQKADFDISCSDDQCPCERLADGRDQLWMYKNINFKTPQKFEIVEKQQAVTATAEHMCRYETAEDRFRLHKQLYWKSCRNQIDQILEGDQQHRKPIHNVELYQRSHNAFTVIPEERDMNSVVFVLGESPLHSHFDSKINVCKECKGVQEPLNEEGCTPKEIPTLDSLGYNSMEDILESTAENRRIENEMENTMQEKEISSKNCFELNKCNNLVTVKEFVPPTLKVEHVKNVYTSTPFKNNKILSNHEHSDTLHDSLLLRSSVTSECFLDSGNSSNLKKIPVHSVSYPDELQNKSIESKSIDQTRQYFQAYNSLRFAPEPKHTSHRFIGNYVQENLPQVSHQELGAHMIAKAKEEFTTSCHCKPSKPLKQLSAVTTIPEEGYQSLEEGCPQERHTSLGDILRSQEEHPLDGIMELNLPQLQSKQAGTKDKVLSTFGWSLFGGVSDHYMTDFCLQGIKGSVRDVDIRNDLVTSTQAPVLGDPVAETVCILADTDQWSVHLISSNRQDGDKTGSCSLRVSMSPIVSGMCESLIQMCKLKMSPEFCLMHLEDRLQELYFRSESLVSYLADNRTPDSLDNAVAVLGFDPTDLPLLMSVALTHAPQLGGHT
ncbi:folliculin-interacting protein 2-like isoform X2 [Limulus polyphemus]|uniref:Folliculin-interacting protein 2-like isoform X2 n=1 Tax=Limulus polyphemus TaxID=6850 RepID=A0ABM1TEV8_LIMPO|nr:folliculin-interacting protein 2-like isoform X2 [Limulus polyphemus]